MILPNVVRSANDENTSVSETWQLETVAVHGASATPIANRPATMPIFQAAAYEFDSLAQAEAIFDGKLAGAQYGTRGAPNVSALESLLRELERAEDAVCTNGGCSALLSVFLAHLRPGATVLASQDLFGGTTVLLKMLTQWGVRTRYVDTTDSEAVLGELRHRPAMVVVETISNPRMRVPDIPWIVDAAHAAGAVVIVDNTLATPLHCRPLQYGADLVVESITKSLSGHFDVVLGGVAGRKDLTDPIRTFVGRGGTAPGGFESWLCARGITSFAVRQERATRNAETVASWLARQPAILAVHYPGHPSHPDHLIASRILQAGMGSMLAFELAASEHQRIDAFLQQLRFIRLVHSLGGPSTTVSHPLTMTHRLIDSETQSALGLHPGYFRLSVGLEAADSICRDLERGLAAISR